MTALKLSSRTFDQGVQTLLISILFFFCFSAEAQQGAEKSITRVFHIQSYFSEAYLVENNDKLVLIETGVPVPGYSDSLVRSIQALGFDPSDIALAVVTHGHGDHAGNAKFLQEKFHIPIVGSQYDLGKFTTGKTELSKSEDLSIWGARLRSNMDMSYPPFTPDVLVEKAEISMSKYGIDGKIIPLEGGHTPGDLAVLIGDQLFVGDAFIGTFQMKDQGLISDGHHVREHFYLENRALINRELQTIEKIAIENKVATIYPTHFGPVTTADLTRYIKGETTLKRISEIQTDLLNEIAQGKITLVNKFLSDNFVLINDEGIRFSKAEFIEKYIRYPGIKTGTRSAEYFRIVYKTSA